MVRGLPLLLTLALAVGAGCVPARIDPQAGLSVGGILKAIATSPSPSGVIEVDEFGSPIPSRPPAAASQAPSTGGCDASMPTGAPVTGTAAQGAYAGKQLPAGWGVHASEAAVTEAIRKLEGGDGWACFQKFYPEALAAYRSRSLA